MPGFTQQQEKKSALSERADIFLNNAKYFTKEAKKEFASRKKKIALPLSQEKHLEKIFSMSFLQK